ncbi:efflux RND transporter periplasmic adaptor subunit [Sneathiella sp.]|jgi:multidrug efflux system membrane fusion protein|uniref:efflux RND transporter periplasmic adaptor subunit n=1 Tax=Sneathiella sp. TaxID=1964365 RepID=UPI0039E37B11
MLSGKFKIVLPVLILAVGFGAYSYLKHTKVEEKPVPVKERVWNVAVKTVKRETLAPRISLFGTLMASREVELRSLVAGEIIRVSDKLKEGSILEKGDLLIEIDPFEYDASLAEKKASALEARSRLEELQAVERSEKASLVRDKEILALELRNLERSEALRKKGNISVKSLDDAKNALSRQRQTVEQRAAQLDIQRARIGQQKAVLARLEIGIKRAERDLKNTELRAPFRGYVDQIEVELGKRVDARDKVARLIDASSLEAQFHLSDRQFGLLQASKEGVIGRPVTVKWVAGDKDHLFDGRIARIGSEISASTGGLQLYAVLQPNGGTNKVRPGAFVDVILSGEKYPNALQLPEHAVYEGKKVYVIVDGRIEERTVEIVYNNGATLLVTGDLKDGEQLITTRFAEIGPGLKVEVR